MGTFYVQSAELFIYIMLNRSSSLSYKDGLSGPRFGFSDLLKPNDCKNQISHNGNKLFLPLVTSYLFKTDVWFNVFKKL